MAEEPVRRVKVWDGWIRFFHWSVVFLLAVSWVSIRTGNVEVHYVSGYAMLSLLLFRIAWGVAGSDTARFARFLRSPLAGLRHLGRFRRREPDTEIGHNAAGGWMVLVLLGLLFVQAATGLFANHEPGFSYDAHGPLALKVGDGTSAWLTGVHHLNFNLVLVAVGLHVLAVLAYRVVKGHDLIGPMVTGSKSLPARLAAPRMGSPALAAAFLTAAALAVWGVSRLG